MTTSESKQPEKGSKVIGTDSDYSSADNDSDKTITNKNFNSTQIAKTEEGIVDGKFDIPKRETNPDKTGIDTESDKTKKEK